jgi:phosphoenolpyruvate phosphomutase
MAGVHDAFSAILASHAGFQCLWASGLGMSAAAGRRDANELSSSQILDQLEPMADCTDAPILVDGDSGHGDFNNARLFVRALVKRGLAGVCFEDKRFPKRNSFADAEHELVAPGEFSGKLRAARDAAPDFCIVARTEALIAGRGKSEALDRAAAYVEAGADAILIHSKARDAEEVLDFAGAWNGLRPLVVVPSTYEHTPMSVFQNAGVSLVIWANQAIRAAMVAMDLTYRHLLSSKPLAALDLELAPLDALLTLLNHSELREAEVAYGSWPSGIINRRSTAAAVSSTIGGLKIDNDPI